MVIVARNGWGNINLVNEICQLGLNDRVTVKSYIDNGQLAILYKNTYCLVMPSLYEGFGLPILEAQSFLYVADAAAGTIAAGESPATMNQIIHLGSEQEIKILDLAQTIMHLINRDDEVKLHPSPEGSVKRRAPNVSKLRKLTGFEPKYSLEDGLLKTIQFYPPPGLLTG